MYHGDVSSHVFGALRQQGMARVVTKIFMCTSGTVSEPSSMDKVFRTKGKKKL